MASSLRGAQLSKAGAKELTGSEAIVDVWERINGW
jgi:hypothetical protein